MFNKGDFVVCISNTDSSYQPVLTIGKKYEVLYVRYDLVSKNGAITIQNDEGEYGIYDLNRFISIEQAREEKLNKLI